MHICLSVRVFAPYEIAKKDHCFRRIWLDSLSHFEVSVRMFIEEHGRAGVATSMLRDLA